MLSEEKKVAKLRQRKQTSLECLEKPLKKKRGRKPLSSSPPASCPVPLSFFKVLIGSFKDVLLIPPMAACTLKGLAKKYVFIEDVDEKCWSVRISMVDGLLAFENGWHDFVSDHSITVGEFVLFTYNGGLLFTARIFGTTALERVDFQIKRRKGRCAKEICTTELKHVNARIPKRPKISQASEEKHYPFSTKVLRSSKTKITSVKCSFPEVNVIECDSISEGVQELSSATEKPLFDSNSRESDITLHDSEQTWRRNSDAKVGELKSICRTELVDSDVKDIDAVARKSIGNRMHKTEKGAGLMHSSGILPLKQTAEEPDAMTKTDTRAVEAQSDIKEESAAMSGSLEQMHEEHDEINSDGKIEEGHSHELEMLDIEAHDDKMTSLSNGEHAECSPKMEFNLIKTEGIAEVFLSADGICHTSVDENLIELATGASFNTNGQEEPSCQNVHETHDDKMSSLPNCEHAECSPKVEFNLIKTEGVAKMFLSADGICHFNVEENIVEVATGVSFNTYEQEDPPCQNDHEAHDEKITSLCEHAECSPKLEFNLRKIDGIAEVFLSADGICHTNVDQNVIELATGASFNRNGKEEPPCQNDHATFGSRTSVPREVISTISSNPTLDHTNDKKETLMSVSEEYGVPQTKGIAHDESFDEVEKNYTPCSSQRCMVKIGTIDSADIIPSSSANFSVCLSDHVQSFLELQNTFAYQIGRLKLERKIVLLQDLSMRCWPVMYHQSSYFVGFIGGWIDFAMENNICRGDICEFELISKMELKYRVQITKSEESIFLINK